jgi:hypothetical protein
MVKKPINEIKKFLCNLWKLVTVMRLPISKFAKAEILT